MPTFEGPSSGGDEADKLYRLDLADKRVTLLTESNERPQLATWTHATGQLVTLSLPLDRTAQGVFARRSRRRCRCSIRCSLKTITSSLNYPAAAGTRAPCRGKTSRSR